MYGTRYLGFVGSFVLLFSCSPNTPFVLDVPGVFLESRPITLLGYSYTFYHWAVTSSSSLCLVIHLFLLVFWERRGYHGSEKKDWIGWWVWRRSS